MKKEERINQFGPVFIRTGRLKKAGTWSAIESFVKGYHTLHLAMENMYNERTNNKNKQQTRSGGGMWVQKECLVLLLMAKI